MSSQNQNVAASRSLIWALERFRKENAEIEVPAILIFLHTALKPGIQLKELERQAGLSKSANNRWVKYLSDEHWRKDAKGRPLPGLGLIVTVPDPMGGAGNPKIARLTPRGQRLFEQVVFVLGQIVLHQE